jgi:type I restriction enzyme M protein
MANKKVEQDESKKVLISGERAELHKTIWKMAEDCRGSVDGWDFKQYVLGLLFYRFISENLIKHINKIERKLGKPNFDYAAISDETAENARKVTTDEKGFYILPSELFCNVAKRPELDENLNENLKKVFENIEASANGYGSENDIKGLFDDLDLSSNKLGKNVNERNAILAKLLNSIASLKLDGDYNDNQIDAFGDAYEFLMNMYASSGGKSGGQFFTPQEVGELLARIASGGREKIGTVYDPCCGSGSLLLKFAKILGRNNVDKYCGQEINITSYNLCRINMFLHNINYIKFDIAHGDTLLNPHHDPRLFEKPFSADAIVSNPPYSQNWPGSDDPTLINDPRFSPAGVLAPKSNADFAFTMHMLACLSDSGICAIVEFPGILYRGGAERLIRKYLTEGNFVDAVIQMPAGLFFGVGIATCILVLKKNKKNDNTVLFIDASDECISNSNRGKNDKKTKMLSPQNIENILKHYKDRTDKDHISHVASFDEIKNNDFNLSVNKYVEKKDDRPQVDILALNAEIKEIVKKQNAIRRELDKIIDEIEKERSGK